MQLTRELLENEFILLYNYIFILLFIKLMQFFFTIRNKHFSFLINIFLSIFELIWFLNFLKIE